MDLYAVYLDFNKDNILDSELLSYVSEDKKNRIKSFVNYADAQRTLIADVLIRSIVSEKFDISIKEVRIDKNKYGKPFIKNVDKFHFNISHSGNWIICVTDTDDPVGVDIEKIRDIDLNIAKTVFTTQEYEGLMKKSASERLRYFFDLWTLKESYLKLIGKGLSIPLNSFGINISNNNITMENNKENKGYFFRQFNLDNDYKLSICAKNQHFPESAIVKQLNNLIEKLTD